MITFKTADDFNKYFDEHHKTYEGDDDAFDITGKTTEDIINYFINGNRLDGYVLLWEALSNLVSPLMNPTDFYSISSFSFKASADNKSASFKLLSDFSTKKSVDQTTDIVLKDSTCKANISGTSIHNEVDIRTKYYMDDSKGNYCEYDDKYIKNFEINYAAMRFDNSNLEITFGNVSLSSWVHIACPRSWYPKVI